MPSPSCMNAPPCTSTVPTTPGWTRCLPPHTPPGRWPTTTPLLRSPAGSAFRGMVMQDPIGLRNLFLAGQGDLASGLGGNYKLYQNHFFTPDTTVALAFLSPNFASFDSGKGSTLTEMIEDEIARFHTEYPGIEVLYHGAPVQSAYNSKRIKTDLLLTISVSLVLIIALLLACFRNKSNIAFLIMPVVYGVLFALAVVYFIKGSMSLMAMGIGAIVMGVAFSYCLHVITHFKYVNDAEAVLKDETNAVLNGMLTTIGAFMGLLLTQSELLRDFGMFASLGMLGTTAFSLLFLPQFFNPAHNRKSEKAFRLLERVNSYPLPPQALAHCRHRGGERGVLRHVGARAVRLRPATHRLQRPRRAAFEGAAGRQDHRQPLHRVLRRRGAAAGLRAAPRRAARGQARPAEAGRDGAGLLRPVPPVRPHR